MEDKYRSLSGNYLSFDVFENILEAINKRTDSNDDPMFKAGVASADAAVRRLRQEYYETIIKIYVQEDTDYNK